MSISSNILKLNKDIQRIKDAHNITYPINVLVATKYAKPEHIPILIENGLCLFGENRLQQFEYKFKEDNQEASWHMIGHLQTNKVNKVVRFFNCIESLDSFKLIEKVNESATNQNKPMEGFIQVNIANDPKKYGFTKKEVQDNIDKFFSFKMLKIKGIMAIVPYMEDAELCRSYFKEMKALFDTVQGAYPSVQTLSMGMSNDYHIAIEEGANLIRIGSLIFKE